MDLVADSLRSDGLADLVRAAMALAKGREERCFWFLEQSEKKIGKTRLNKKLINLENNTYWAEKILDEFYRLRWGEALLRKTTAGKIK